MSEHSKFLDKKMAELDQKEKELKEELALVSDDFGKSARNVAIMTLIAGVVAFSAYSLFRLFAGSKKKDAPKEEVQKGKQKAASVAASGGIKYMVAEKVVTAALAFLGNLIAEKVADSQRKKTAKDS